MRHESGETNWLDVNSETANALISWLNEYYTVKECNELRERAQAYADKIVDLGREKAEMLEALQQAASFVDGMPVTVKNQINAVLSKFSNQ